MKIKTTPITLGSKGYYDLNVYKANGEEVVEKRITGNKNVVTYAGAYLLFFYTNPGIFGALGAKVGTGTAEITRSATSLGNPNAASSSTDTATRPGTEVDNGDGTSTLTVVREMSFSLGQLVGTFSEVGMVNGSTLVAGQLIKDAMGNPTTVTILADEQLTVTYTLELTIPNGELAVQPVSGTGTVTTPEGTSSWTAYNQPFFRDFSLNSSNVTPRMSAHSGILTYANSSGTKIKDQVSAPSGAVSHDGSGTVTQTTSAYVAPPSLFSSSDVKYICFGGTSGVNTTTKRTAFAESLVVEFSPALVKDSARSLKAEFELTWNI